MEGQYEHVIVGTYPGARWSKNAHSNAQLILQNSSCRGFDDGANLILLFVVFRRSNMYAP